MHPLSSLKIVCFPAQNISEDDVALYRLGVSPCRTFSDLQNPKSIICMRTGADVTVADHDGMTPLHNAAQEGNVAILELLLGSGS